MCHASPFGALISSPAAKSVVANHAGIGIAPPIVLERLLAVEAYWPILWVAVHHVASLAN
jgi:hypothetical protein